MERGSRNAVFTHPLQSYTHALRAEARDRPRLDPGWSGKGQTPTNLTGPGECLMYRPVVLGAGRYCSVHDPLISQGSIRRNLAGTCQPRLPDRLKLWLLAGSRGGPFGFEPSDLAPICKNGERG